MTARKFRCPPEKYDWSVDRGQVEGKIRQGNPSKLAAEAGSEESHVDTETREDRCEHGSWVRNSGEEAFGMGGRCVDFDYWSEANYHQVTQSDRRIPAARGYADWVQSHYPPFEDV